MSSSSVPSAAQAQTASTQQLIADIQAAVTQAQAEGAGGSPAQQAALEAFTRQAQATILDLQTSLVGSGAPLLYRVQAGDTLPVLAQQFLGDPAQFRAIQRVNGMRGLYIAPGTVLTIPAGNT